MLETFGRTQQNLLHALHAHKSGMTLEELAEVLSVTRTAVRQHVSALELQGFIEKGELCSSGGRPSQIYQLTNKGFAIFPKQYAMLSSFVLQAILKEKGADGLADWMKNLGHTVAGNLKSRVADTQFEKRLIKTVDVMNTLAYDARVAQSETGKKDAIEVFNCVYHELASEYPQICQFDLALLSNLTDSEVIHEKCIQHGDNVCRFRFKDKPNHEV